MKGKCRICGCTDALACITPAGPCHWIEDDLCSACGIKAGILELGAEDLDALENAQPLTVELNAPQAFMVLAALQLSLRHPAYDQTHATTQFITFFAAALQRYCSLTPNLEKLCEAGWHVQNDVPGLSRLILPSQ